MENVVKLVAAIAWPAVVIGVLYFFRVEIRSALKGIEAIVLPGGAKATFRYADVAVDRPENRLPAQTQALSAAGVAGGKSGNLFWLGHDLMWTIDVLLRGGSRELVVRGLRQSLHHASSFGFEDAATVGRLQRLLKDADLSLEADWTTVKREAVARDVGGVIATVGQSAEISQPGFVPRPT